MKACPECQSDHIHRSHARGFWEPIQKRFTAKRIFRCHDCGWRGWLETGRSRSAFPHPASMRLGPLVLIVAAAIAIGTLIAMGLVFRK
jgi:hypothetical protein